MNADRMRQIAADIRAHEDMFTMESTGDPECGVPGCIIGFCEWRLGDAVIDTEDAVGKFLGLTPEQGDKLFSPKARDSKGRWSIVPNEMLGRREITAEHAARCLEYAAEHGVIDWDASAP